MTHSVIFKTPDALQSTILQFRNAIAPSAGRPTPIGLCGFDGFIDSFVNMRHPATMAEFGAGISRAAGISASYQVEREDDKFGGNGPLLTAALHTIFSGNINLDYIGALGETAVLPVYQDALGDKTRNLYTLAEPAHSDCLEFTDGKIMLGDFRNCEAVTWERLLKRVGEDTLDTLLAETQFIAAVNWGKLPHVGAIWQNLAQRLSKLGRAPKSVLFFMDLAEFEQRPEADCKELLPLLSEVTRHCRTVLSLNLKEAWQLGSLVGGDFHGKKDAKSILALATFLREKLGVDKLIIHPNDAAVSVDEESAIYIPGPLCAEPLISTGAGDHFGAGVLAATLHGLDAVGILLAGAAASGYFVRTGESPSFAQMATLLEAWAQGRLAERL